jgi:hypothetical protein
MRRLVLALALLSACGDDDSGGGPIPIDELDGAAVNAACSFYVNCGLIDDVSTCRGLDLDIGFLDPSLRAAVDAGKVIYHGDKARACLGTLPGSCDRTDFDRNEGGSVCDQIFEGTVAGGGQCALDEECISQDCSVPACTEACCQGTCVGDAAPVLPKVGESCAMTFECENSFCDFTTDICTAYRQLGEACTSTSECAMGGCLNDVCTVLPDTGEPCVSTASGSQCRNLGDVCSTTTNTCVAFGLEGDPCLNERECSPLYECNASQVCTLRSTLGDTCDPQAFGCIDRSYCDETTLMCTAPKADGAACMNDEECTGDCDFNSNTCMTPPLCF